jgi:formate dehydrogenase major subunit
MSDGLSFPGGLRQWITNPAFDPVTQTAEYKACAVAIEKM